MGQTIEAMGCTCMTGDDEQQRIFSSSNLSNPKAIDQPLASSKTVFSAIRGYIARRKILPSRRKYHNGKLEAVPFPPLVAAVQEKYDILGAYYTKVYGKDSYKLPGGTVYAGDWEHFLLHGFGQCVTPKGEIYEGEFRYHEYSGLGRMIFADGSVYTGSWKRGEFHGHGRSDFGDGNSYSGDWLEGKKHGHGDEQWTNGSSYSGEYFYGSKTGKGRFDW